MKNKSNLASGLVRIALGWILFWAFLDKLFGLGFTTEAGNSWIDGTSPTSGFLKFASQGIFAPFFQSLAGQVWVDWLFMLGLLFIGLSLILGIAIRLATTFGSIMMLLMYLTALPPENNPLVDKHIIYIFVMIWLQATDAGQNMGLGEKWSKIPWVKKYPCLK